jgi:hypothetical protein
MERARREGIPVGSASARRGRLWALALAAALLIVMVESYVWRPSRFGRETEPEAGGKAAILSERVRNLERRIAEMRQFQPAPVKEPAKAAEPDRGIAEQILRYRRDYESAVAGKALLEEKVSQLASQSEELRRQALSARADAERLQQNLSATERALARAEKDLDALRAGRAADAMTIADQRRSLEQLSARVQGQIETLERERQLLAYGKDIRDLMGARNLRIVDVEDRGAAGKQRSIPGRIFYTQGKSLIFYAYDLQNKGNVNKVAFQAWGKREGRSQPPRSLGIFYTDDAAQKRWVLKFEDPEVLAQIDQVFVTVEPPGGSTQPTNRPFLTAAFLNDAANHP